MDGETCEQCGAPHGAQILRSIEDSALWLVLTEDYGYETPDGYGYRLSEIPDEFALNPKLTTVVLCSVMTHECVERRLCQRCTLLATTPQRKASARKTRLKKKRERKRSEGQFALFGDDDE